METYLGSVIDLSEYRDVELKEGDLVPGEIQVFLTLRLKNARGDERDFKVKGSPQIIDFFGSPPSSPEAR
jgi:hypothetical protein